MAAAGAARHARKHSHHDRHLPSGMGSSVAAPASHADSVGNRIPPHPHPPLEGTGRHLAADQRPSGLQQEHRPPLGSEHVNFDCYP